MTVVKKNIICVTQKSLVQDNFFERMEKIILAEPFAIILREKELSLPEYAKLAESLALLCNKKQVDLFFNTEVEFCINLANQLNCHLHTSFANYQRIKHKVNNIKIGISIHSLEEAYVIQEDLEKKMQVNSISHILAGHIFATKCKEGLEPKGLEFLEQVVKILPIPVFGIGGITEQHKIEFEKMGAGVALMSSLMTSPSPLELIEHFQ